MHTPHGFLDRLLHALVTEAHPLGWWSYVILALIVMVEGPVATLVGAGAASAGLLNPFIVFFSAAIGNLTGDLLWYSLGRLGKVEWLLQHGHLFGLSRAKMLDMEQKLRQNVPKIVFAAKLTLVFMIPVLVTAGMLRVRLRRWFPIDAVAETIWTGSLVAAGYFLSGYIIRLERGLQIVAAAGFAVCVIAGLLFLRHYGARWEKTHRSLPEEPPAGTTARQGNKPLPHRP